MVQRQIDQALDDRLTGEDVVSEALQENYLGDPAVVGGIVADFCLFVRDLVEQRAKGELDAAGFKAKVVAERDRLAEIIAGKDPAYAGVPGWTNYSLRYRLIVELGQFWQAHKAENDRDPHKAVFAWLCWAVVDTLQKANGDQDMEVALLSVHTGQIIRLLLGTDKRVA